MLTEDPELYPGLASIVHQYDGFLCDLWGVIHDGTQPYDGVLTALDRLKAHAKTVVFISNVPRPAPQVRAMLTDMGIPEGAYTDLVTSADITRVALAARDDAFHAALGSRFYLMGRVRCAGVLDGLAYTQVDRIEDADFVVACALDEGETVDDVRPTLGEARARDLPLICVNPDLVVMHGPEMTVCAGTLAAEYVEAGGRVAWHGKPHPRVYRHAMARHPAVTAGRWVMVGDTLRTDVAGAHAVDIDALLVTHGIHAEELDLEQGAGQIPDLTRLDALYAKHQMVPNAALPAFVWGD